VALIAIDATTSIHEDELTFTASRGGGPGGQHVNKVSTRVTLSFDLAHSPSLDDTQRRRLLQRLGHRLTGEGMLKLSCGRSRSQRANRLELLERFTTLLADALKPRRSRVATRPSKGSKEQRLDTKRRRARLKRARTSTDD
jgi:ribosome-associated protein